jgi:hypothetical protein
MGSDISASRGEDRRVDKYSIGFIAFTALARETSPPAPQRPSQLPTRPRRDRCRFARAASTRRRLRYSVVMTEPLQRDGRGRRNDLGVVDAPQPA